MNIFQISCRSNCGTYFVPYLQSLTIMAEDKAQAIEEAEKWLIKNNEKFLYPKEKWDIEQIGEAKVGVIDYVSDSDY